MEIADASSMQKSLSETPSREFCVTSEKPKISHTLCLSMGQVVEAKAPSKKANILCIGDSLTCAGYWSFEGFRRFALDGGTPEGLGFKDSLNLIGTVKKKVGEDEIGHEGYGSWQWRTFCTSSVQSKTSAVWVEAPNHNKTQEDQHSVWINNERKWILETIEEKRLKFKRGEGNNDLAPELKDEFVMLENATNKENIKIKYKKWLLLWI